MKRFKNARFATLTTALALVPVIFLQWRNYFPAPPQLSSPSVSNGFTLHKIREEKDPDNSYCVVLSPPWLPNKSLNKDRTLYVYAPEDAFRVTAIASTGARWTLNWHTEDNTEDSELPAKQLLITNIPKIYPSMYEWMDIEVQNKRGGVAKWHLTGLAKGINTVPSAPQVQPTYAADGLFIYAYANIWQGKYKPWVSPSGDAGFYAVALPNSAHYWKIDLIKQESQWQARRLHWKPDSHSIYSQSVPETSLASVAYAKSHSETGGLILDIPYLPDNRFARLTLRVEEYASAGDSGGTLVSSRIIELTCPITQSKI